ncbi:MAG TPA: undecaprenyl-diphosphate phosphatase [Lachnospiraceae bacterium]|nr:undecaprenyl-diphosphate phosphatase [Lachnospiraceae bacterium]
MPVWKALILGLVQGLAEFLPVSSSGHLIIIKQVLGVDLGSGGMFFDVMLHFGTLVAIFAVFWKDIRMLIVEGIHIFVDIFANAGIFFARIVHRDKTYRYVIRSSYRKFVLLIIISTIPTAIIGLLLSDIIEAANSMIIVPGICLFITAVFLFIADFIDAGDKTPKEASYIGAGMIGIAQGLATMPGISRSGTTITACLLCGFDKKFAVKYSFIMSIPAVLGAVVLELKDFTPDTIVSKDIPGCIIATVVAAVTGYLSICFMMSLVSGKKYKYFAVYCIIAGGIAVGYHFLGQ